MVELSASSVVCRAICAIRLTTLPIAAEDSRRRSTLALASRAAALAWSASLLASRTCAPMPCAEWVNLSAACEKVVAVVCAALVRPVRASVRWRMVESVAAVASAPPATELAARSSWRIMRAEFEFQQFEDFLGRIAFGAASARSRRSAPEPWARRQAQPVPARAFETDRTPWGSLDELRMWRRILSSGHEVMVNNCLIFRQASTT